MAGLLIVGSGVGLLVAGGLGGSINSQFIAKTPSWTNFGIGAVATMVSIPAVYMAYFQYSKYMYDRNHPATVKTITSVAPLNDSKTAPPPPPDL
jgi:hypothetical protein